MLNLTELSSEPIHNQISRQLLEKIIGNDFSAGTELMSIRTLARKERVNINTIKKAYLELEQNGIIERQSNDRFVIASITNKQKKRIARKLFKSNRNSYDIRDELEVAGQIQKSLLPRSLPCDDQLCIEAYSQPSRTVGGDFYDYIPLGTNKFGMVIGDACGKGLPAAILISQIQAIIRSEANNRNRVSEILRYVNQQLIRFTLKNKFVTLFYGELDRELQQFTYVRAGHYCPLLIHSNGSFENLETGGPALGIFPDITLQTRTVNLESGDVICLYTDGVTETFNKQNDEYGEERLLETLIRNREKDVGEITDAVLADLKDFNPSENLQDDRTLLILKIN